ncbi:MAG: hypothetical protein JNM26_10695, partial [Ideonella sp.]|nr:hypothetical protein [Ideonella sp.]
MAAATLKVLTMGGLWFVFGLLWLLLGAVASFRWMPRDGRVDVARKYWDVVAQPGAELTPQMMLIALVVCGGLFAANAHRSGPGWAGAVLTAMALGLLLLIFVRAAGEQTRFDGLLRQALGTRVLDELPPERRAAATAPGHL